MPSDFGVLNNLLRISIKNFEEKFGDLFSYILTLNFLGVSD